MNIKTCTKLHNGPLSNGCSLCVTGEKSVIFVTGICHYTCFYCPISDDKRGKDIVKINEHIIKEPDSDKALLELFSEIKNCQSKGASLTGGDPLAKLDRTIYYIKSLKKQFGKDFHIHLYTSLPFVTQEALLKLEQAGLDEIRFHAQMDDIDSWEKIFFAQDVTIDVGAEIPVLPGMKEKTKEFINFCKQSEVISFINLNELEYSDVSENKLTQRGFVVKDILSYGIQDSEQLAKELIDFAKEIDMRVHYCSAGFKDGIQLANRLLLRSQKIAKDYDIEDEEGMLTRGEIKIINKNSVDIEALKLELQEEFDIPDELLAIDEERILIASWVLEEILPELKEKSSQEGFNWLEDVEFAIIKEYPTDDHFLLEREVL